MRWSPIVSYMDRWSLMRPSDYFALLRERAEWKSDPFPEKPANRRLVVEIQPDPRRGFAVKFEENFTK